MVAARNTFKTDNAYVDSTPFISNFNSFDRQHICSGIFIKKKRTNAIRGHYYRISADVYYTGHYYTHTEQGLYYTWTVILIFELKFSDSRTRSPGSGLLRVVLRVGEAFLSASILSLY